MSWADLVPSHIAMEQDAWERRRWIQRRHELGASMAELARELGISPTRVRQHIAKAARKDAPPVRVYLTGGGDIAKLAYVLEGPIRREQAKSRRSAGRSLTKGVSGV